MRLPYTVDSNGIYRPGVPITRRDREYDESGVDMLFQMQEEHFRYRVRHRHTRLQQTPLHAMNLGGAGVGGWESYLANRREAHFKTHAPAESSNTALTHAKNALPASAQRYQIGLIKLVWENRWDCAFRLNVIEHLPITMPAQ
jgi:hypothetical protein